MVDEERDWARKETHRQLTDDTNQKIMLIWAALCPAKCFRTTPFMCGRGDVNLFTG